MYQLKNSGVNDNLLDLIELFLHNRHQGFVFSGQSSNWKFVKSGVPQRSVLGPLLFLIYINDLPQRWISAVKLFAAYTSSFPIFNCAEASPSILNSNLLKIQDWACQWKVPLTPDRTKQAQEVLFSRRAIRLFIHLFILTKQLWNSRIHQKHFGLQIGGKLSLTNILTVKSLRQLKV